MKQKRSMGECRFCGQISSFEEEELTEGQANEKATMLCGCEAAAEYQRTEIRKERAKSNINTLFAQGEGRVSEKIVKIMENAVEDICGGSLTSINLDIRGGIKAKIKRSASGEIQVERAETKKQKLSE